MFGELPFGSAVPLQHYFGHCEHYNPQKWEGGGAWASPKLPFKTPTDLEFGVLLHTFRPHSLHYATEIAQEFPDLRLIIDHIAKPKIKEGEFDNWAKDMSRAASCPNVYVKLWVCKSAVFFFNDDVKCNTLPFPYHKAEWIRASPLGRSVAFIYTFKKSVWVFCSVFLCHIWTSLYCLIYLFLCIDLVNLTLYSFGQYSHRSVVLQAGFLGGFCWPMVQIERERRS